MLKPGKGFLIFRFNTKNSNTDDQINISCPSKKSVQRLVERMNRQPIGYMLGIKDGITNL